jgi:hypothetical protein
MIRGARKRFLTQPAPIRQGKLSRKTIHSLQTFVRKKIAKMISIGKLRRIPNDSDTSARTWLEHTNYTEARKKELLEQLVDWTKFSTKRGEKDRKLVNKSFVKTEFYPEIKELRCINGRTDAFKVRVGPIFKLIEKEIFKLTPFIKKVPVSDRAKYVNDLLNKPERKFMETDYSSFEALFTKEIMEAVEFQVYNELTKELPEHEQFMDLIRTALLGTNVSQFKEFTTKVEATRMSGEMNTSLGNGLSNWLIMKYVAYRSKIKIKCVIEGDDGLISIPTSSNLKMKYFEKLGLVIKFDVYDDIQQTSFCGLTFDMLNNSIITEPIGAMIKFFWLNGRYIQASDLKLDILMRAKSLSYLYSYSQCPILRELAEYGMRMTNHISTKQIEEVYSTKNFDLYTREKMTEALLAKVPEKNILPTTRLIMEKKFGISISDQLLIEEKLASKNDVELIDLGQFRPDLKFVYDKYVRPINVADRWINYMFD